MPKNTAAGLDHWEPEEFGQFSNKVYEVLAVMFNAIEQCATCPDDMQHARAAFLSKDASKMDDPLNYRVRTILPVPYRRWATARLRTLKPWIAQWDMKEMCTGWLVQNSIVYREVESYKGDVQWRSSGHSKVLRPGAAQHYLCDGC